MALQHVQSAPIVNRNSTPKVPNTTGEGAEGYAKEVSGFIVAPASSDVASTFRLVQVPTTAKVKSVRYSTETQAAGAADVGVYYPLSGRTAQPDLAANAIDADFFASAVVLTAVAWTDITNESGVNVPSNVNLPLWQAVGLASDPGGVFDIVATLTTAITTGLGDLGLSVVYVD